MYSTYVCKPFSLQSTQFCQNAVIGYQIAIAYDTGLLCGWCILHAFVDYCLLDVVVFCIQF